MINSVMAIPKAKMESIKEEVIRNNNIIAISIIDPPFNVPVIFIEDTSRIITLRFSDITPGPFLNHSWFMGEEMFMNTSQADQIVKFILKWANDEKEVDLFVNCSAGICRSGAIITWALKHSEMKDIDFIAKNPSIQPNEWILWKLIEAEMNIK